MGGMDSKECKSCREVKRLDEYYLHKMMSDGHLNICKPCVRKRSTERRNAKLDEVRAYDRRRYRTHEHRGKDARAAVKQAVMQRGWDDLPERLRVLPPACGDDQKVRARARTKYAVMTGRLKKADACEVCGYVGRIVCHHLDYSDHMNVAWLCQHHHDALHRADLDIDPKGRRKFVPKIATCKDSGEAGS